VRAENSRCGGCWRSQVRKGFRWDVTIGPTQSGTTGAVQPLKRLLSGSATGLYPADASGCPANWCVIEKPKISRVWWGTFANSPLLDQVSTGFAKESLRARRQSRNMTFKCMLKHSSSPVNPGTCSVWWFTFFFQALTLPVTSPMMMFPPQTSWSELLRQRVCWQICQL